jgi:hypothetical protein
MDSGEFRIITWPEKIRNTTARAKTLIAHAPPQRGLQTGSLDGML